MTGTVIKSFLMSLGFSVNESELSKFNRSIRNATLQANVLYDVIKTGASAIVSGVSHIADTFEELGYSTGQVAPLIQKAFFFRQDRLNAFRMMGVNLKTAVAHSVHFSIALNRLKLTFEALYKSAALKFLPILTNQMNLLLSRIRANLPKIQEASQKFVGFVFKTLDRVIRLGFEILPKVGGILKEIDDKTGGLSTAVIGLGAAWAVLNRTVLSSPLGRVLALLTGLLSIYDDKKTFDEGGKAFFNWQKVIPIIERLNELFGILTGYVKTIFDTMVSLAKGNILDSWRNFITSLLSLHANLLSKTAQTLFEGGKAVYDIATAPPLLGKPLGSDLLNQSTIQTINQATNIIVNGTADAKQTGEYVLSGQENINFNLNRNLRSNFR